MRKVLFIFSHYVDYPWNRSSAVPMPPDLADSWKFTVHRF